MLVGRQWKVGLGGGPGVCGELSCAAARHSPPASRWGPCRSALGMWPSPAPPFLVHGPQEAIAWTAVQV